MKNLSFELDYTSVLIVEKNNLTERIKKIEKNVFYTIFAKIHFIQVFKQKKLAKYLELANEYSEIEKALKKRIKNKLKNEKARPKETMDKQSILEDANKIHEKIYNGTHFNSLENKKVKEIKKNLTAAIKEKLKKNKTDSSKHKTSDVSKNNSNLEDNKDPDYNLLNDNSTFDNYGLGDHYYDNHIGKTITDKTPLTVKNILSKYNITVKSNNAIVKSDNQSTNSEGYLNSIISKPDDLEENDTTTKSTSTCSILDLTGNNSQNREKLQKFVEPTIQQQKPNSTKNTLDSNARIKIKSRLPS
jgi:hypothetical protein